VLGGSAPSSGTNAGGYTLAIKGKDLVLESLQIRQNAAHREI
jgi:hypothetical protein